MNREQYEILDFVPYCEKFTAGYSYAILRKEAVKTLLDLSYDGYQPWTGIDQTTQKAVKAKCSSKNVVRVDGQFVIANDESVASPKYTLKLKTNRHHKMDSFRREIFFILNEESELVTNVVYRYHAEIDLNPPLTHQNRLLPSSAAVIKKALEHRSTIQAKKILVEEGLHVSGRRLTSLSRSVSSHVKTNVGRKTPTDFYNIYNRHLNRSFKDEIIEKPDCVVDDDGKLAVRICFGYPNAVKTFVSALPPREDLVYFRDNVSLITKAPGKEAQQMFNSYLDSVNGSGALPCIGSCISVDTTFSLSTAEYVTLVIGIADDFLNKNSSKSASILLGGMIHSSKVATNHQKFSQFLNELFLDADPNKKKAVGTLLIDGEDSFRCYNEGLYLREAVSLRCDRHRLDNIRSVCGSNQEFECIQKALYGEKERTPLGSVLKESVLQVLNRDAYTERLFRLLNAPFLSPSSKEWLLSNSNSLFEKNSLISKLNGGWPVQFLTTNVIEAKNGWLKSIITSKIPGERLLDELLAIHRVEINDRINAMVGKDSPLSCIMAKSAYEWSKMKILEKRNHLELIGLGHTLVDTQFDSFPSWVFEGHPNIDSYVRNVEELDFFESNEGNVFFLFHRKDDETTKVTTNGYEISCSHKYCIKTCLKTPVCIHKIKVLQKFSEEKREAFLKKIEEDKRGITYMQLMREQTKPCDGSKYSRRKGKTFSSHNETRAIERLSCSFEGVVRFSNTTSSS